MKKKKMLSILLVISIVLAMCPAAAFAEGTFQALGNTNTYLYGDTDEASNDILLRNQTDADVTITEVSVEPENQQIFVSQTGTLEEPITVTAGGQYSYPVTVTGTPAAGDYSATYTFKDSNENTYTATAKAIVIESGATSVDYGDLPAGEDHLSVIWDYEQDETTCSVTFYNCSSKEMALTGVSLENGQSSAFELFGSSEITAENPVAIPSLGEKTIQVKLKEGKNVGTYTDSVQFEISCEVDNTLEGSYGADIQEEVTTRYLTVPTITEAYTYNGAVQKLTDGLDENFIEKYIQLSDVTEVKNAGRYVPVFVLKDKQNTAWKLAGGSTTTVNQSIYWDVARYQVKKPTPDTTVTYTYNKAQQEFSLNDVSGPIFGEEEVIAISGGEKTNAGDSTVTVALKDKVNYEWEDGTDADLNYTWHMDRAKVNEPQTVKTSYDYDSTPKQIEFAENTLDSELMTVTGNSGTAIGTYTVTVALKDKVNYEWQNGSDTDLSFTLSIGTPVYGLPTITGSYTYNGSVQHPALTGFDSEHMTITDNSGKNAGEYQVKIALKDKANAKWADTNTNEDRTLTWTIGKAAVTVQAKDITANAGDPRPTLNADNYTITGIILPDSLGFIPSIRYAAAPDMTQEGSYDIIVSGANASTDGNYAVSYQNATLTVKAAQAAEKIAQIELSFDLPLAGSQDVFGDICHKGINTSFVNYYFEAVEPGYLKVFEQDTDQEITMDVVSNGLTEGQNIYLLISMTPAAGKIIDKDATKVTINGNVLAKEDVQLLADGEKVKVPFTVPAYRIHFKAASGTGSMSAQYAGTAAEYEIPKCGFTAPSGYEFDKWQLEGDASMTYAPGDKVQLTGSINLVALYKEKTSSGSGSGSGGGGFIPGGGGALPGGSTGGGSITDVTAGDVQKPEITVDKGTIVNLSKDGTAASITPADGYTIMEVKLNGKSLGAVDSVSGLKTGDSLQVIVMNRQEVKEYMSGYALVARSKVVTLRDGKKAVRITWSDKNGKAYDFDGVEVQRSLKRSSGYVKMANPEATPRYYNTKIKAGEKYYYRVRGYVVFNGEKIYTPWSYKAWRTVK